MTIAELDNIIKIGDIVIFDEDNSTPPDDTKYSIVNEEGIEYHIVYYYVGEFEDIDNTYIHHYNRDREYLDTLKITLSGEDKELIKVMCNNYKEIY